MTIIKQIDYAIQSAVDAMAFAIMRRLGCGKGPIRFGIYLALVAVYIALAAFDHEPFKVIMAFMWLVIAEISRRADAHARDGIRSVNDIAHPLMKSFWLFLMAVSLAVRPVDATTDVVLLLNEYFRSTPPTPPPSRETSRELATAGGVA